MNRREFVRMALAAVGGTTVAMVASVGSPFLRMARANNMTTTLKTNMQSTCGGKAFNVGGNTCSGCGPSTSFPDVCDGNYWHKVTGDYRMRPDKCITNVATTSGWYWLSTAPCGCPAGAMRRYKCHDGWKRVSGQWVTSICRQTGACIA